MSEPRTVSYLWSQLSRRTERRDADFITYDWFVLALAFLAAVGLVEFSDGRIRHTS